MIPFIPKEFFVVSGVPVGETRGKHAHKVCHQVLILLEGRIEVETDNGQTKKTVVLENSGDFVDLPPLTWGRQTYLTENAQLIVFCSELFDSEDYINDYSVFCGVLGGS